MRILNFLNKKIRNIKDSESGFTIIECILAVGILALLVGSLITVQVSTIAVTKTSSDRLKALWALRSAMAQIDYVLDVKGQQFIPEKTALVWEGNKNFTITIQRKNLTNLKPSAFLKSAMKIQSLSQGDSNKDVDQLIGPIGALLDAGTDAANTTNKDSSGQVKDANSTFCNLIVTVNWPSGAQTKDLSLGMFMIDSSAIANIKMPNMPGSTTDSGPGSTTGGSGSGSGSTGGNP